LWITNAMPSAPFPPSLAVKTTRKDRDKSRLTLLHAVPACEAALGFSCSVADVGDVATPFFVHSVKSCGRVDAEGAGVTEGVAELVGLGVWEAEMVEVGEGEAESVFVEDAEAPGVNGAEGVLVVVAVPVTEAVSLAVPVPVAVTDGV
jgi:hypothetical protein